MNLVNCEICDGSTKYWLSINDYDHYRCKRCKHLFVYPKPSQIDLDNFYKTGEYYNKAEIEASRLIKEAANRMRILNKLQDNHKLNRKLLDIGCASGHFLSVLKTSDWDVTGLERSAVMAEQAINNYGLDVIVGTVENTNIPENTYDFITLWEVIEHVVEPGKFLSGIVRMLKKGGILAISTPMSDGLVAKVMGSKYPMLAPPEHLSLYSSKSINLLANRYDLTPVYFESFSNLGLSSLASGFCRLLFQTELLNLSIFLRVPCYLLGIISFWIPRIIDKLGQGTEMMIIFRKDE